MIKFQNISFVFDGKKVIEDFTEEITQGQRVCLMGESGSGKTTLMKSLMGLSHPSTGSVIVDSMEVTPHNVWMIRSRIAWVPQEVNLPYETVREALHAPFSLKVNSHLEFDEKRMFHLFDQLSLSHDIYHRQMNEISGGERQRLMIALALLLEKKILLLDEPTSALDAQTRDKMIEFIAQLPVTMLAISHDQSFAQSCHRVIHISKIRP